MKTLIRKEWGSPKGNVQVFTPQEFVAQCEMIKPVSNYGTTVYIDVVSGTMDISYTLGPDGICQGASEESFYNGHGPTNTTSILNGHWVENTSIYKARASVTGNASYSDTSQFILVKSPVSVYISTKGNLAYVFEGPTKPDVDIHTDNYGHLEKTFS